ncbi:MAG: lysophospholipid acyltransferase family protein [Planctomycetota bacterium]|nr:lysophospholipid acyltransferase family protein [Planctomycetota bacterium]
MAVVVLLLGFPFALLVLLFTIGNVYRRARVGAIFSHIWATTYCFLFGLRIESEGTPPPRGSFAVCNHISHFDVLIIARMFPTSLVSKKEIRKWPVIGFMAAAVGTVFVDRGDRDKTAGTVAQLSGYLREGATISLFPEGQTGEGDRVLPFKRSLFAVPADLGLPTHPMALVYKYPATAWADDTPFVVHMFRQLGRPTHRLKIIFGEPIPAGMERKPLAFEAQARVEQLFERAHWD